MPSDPPQPSDDQTQATTFPDAVPADDDAAATAAALAGLPVSHRYRLASAIGAGGMGEVLIAHDAYLVRDVVIKRLRSAAPTADAVSRFLREARVQGRLEHPAIVPVHDLAVDEGGRPFFAMKRLDGHTLVDILTRPGAGEATGAWSRARLLRAFADVCLAIELAHTRGVVHRDLKPANILLGDFGEVYVLDWGVARILGDDQPESLRAHRPSAPAIGRGEATVIGRPPTVPSLDADVSTEPGATLPGSILGTLGYMAPEQLRGDPDVGPAADIHALGCILFEILASEPLHPRQGAAASTLSEEVDARPSRRNPDRPGSPELDTVCVLATAAEPSARFPSARAIADAVQGFLDGDRDLALRKDLAERHITEARAALARGDRDEHRRAAMRAAGRALALDPASSDAAELVSLLILTPPSAVPREVRASLDAIDLAHTRGYARFATLAYVLVALYLPVMMVIGIKDWGYITACYAVVAANLLNAAAAMRAQRPPRVRQWAGVIGTAMLVALFGRLIGPFVLPVGLATVAMAVAATHPFLTGRVGVVIAIFVLSALGPWALEALGALPRTYDVTSDGYSIHSLMLDASPIAGQLAIAGYVAIVIVMTGLILLRVTRQHRQVRDRLETQAWHLRQLVPSPGSVPPPPPR